MTLHTLRGLDDRDLALVALACTHRALFLENLAAGDYDDGVASAAGYQHDRNLAAGDANRLRYIAEAMGHA